MKTELTSRQHTVLKILNELIVDNDFSPTIREFADVLGFTVRAASDYLKLFEKRGYITRIPGKARTIKIIKFPERG